MEHPTAKRTDCLQCRHYYITWDKDFPYGCRAMGFKSRVRPCLEVVAACQQTCLAFEPKE